MKKSFGLFVELIAAIVGIVSIVMYGGSLVKTQNTYIFLIAAVVVAVIAAIGAQKNPGVCNWGAPIAAALAAAGIGYSITVMSDAIGYVISGLYTMDEIRGWVNFMIAACIAWLLYMIAGFTGMAKEA